MTDLLPAAMVLTLMVMLFTGYPVGLVLIGVSTVYAVVAVLTDQMSTAMLNAFSYRVYGLLADNLIFPAVPPLVFMGVTLARSGLAGELFEALSYLLRRMPSSLPLAVLFLGILLAPSAGLIGAAVAVLATASIPSMLSRGYPPSLAAGSVAAAGTLGVILPPGIMLFFLADLVGAPIAGAFVGILLPAALLVIGYVILVVALGLGRARRATDTPDRPAGIARKLALPTVLIGGVLTAIVSGWATPSQSGALGALGAFLLMFANRSFSWPRLKEILIETGHVTAMVFLVIIAANTFSLVFRVMAGDEMVAHSLASLGLGKWGTLLFVLGVIFLLGFFIDWLEIVLITLPIFMPVIGKLDFAAHVGDALMVKVWIGAAIAVVLQTSFLTPPFGFALFFLRGSAPGVRMAEIYRGVAPLVAIQLAVLAAVLAVPWLATRLARLVIN